MWQKLDRSLGISAQGMDGSALRQKVLSNNIANVDTPHFKSQDVNFYDQLKQMTDGRSLVNSSSLPLARTHEKHIGVMNGPLSNFQVNQIDGKIREDGNNVNIDVEMAKIAENNLYYSTLATTVAKKYRMLSQAITKGGER